MDEIIAAEKAKPKYIISDRGSQFDCGPYRKWCKSHEIKPRYGAVGKHGSIAITERYHRTMKTELTRRILVPTSYEEFDREMKLWKKWYNGTRPHDSLKGRTPDEVYFGRRAANTLPRIEPRPKVTHRTPCANHRDPTGSNRSKGSRRTFLHGGPTSLADHYDDASLGRFRVGLSNINCATVVRCWRVVPSLAFFFIRLSPSRTNYRLFSR